jgi:hypothetical protein
MVRNPAWRSGGEAGVSNHEAQAVASSFETRIRAPQDEEIGWNE